MPSPRTVRFPIRSRAFLACMAASTAFACMARSSTAAAVHAPSVAGQTYVACLAAMRADLCQAAGPQARSASAAGFQADVFVAGVGLVPARVYRELAVAGPRMCDVVREACTVAPAGALCATAGKLWSAGGTP